MKGKDQMFKFLSRLTPSKIIQQAIIHAVYFGVGAAVGFVALHLTGLGLSAETAAIIGAALTSIASRLQAKAEPPSA